MIKNPGGVPILSYWESRRWAIINGHDAKIVVQPRAQYKGDPPWYREHDKGVNAVTSFDGAIETEAHAIGLDPNLIRAIMYVENADGSRYGVSRLAEKVGMADTLFPMNIDARLWAGMGGVKAQEFENPVQNIRAAAALLKAISDRVEDPTVAKIASLYNSLPKDNVTDYGARVQRAYDEKLWER